MSITIWRLRTFEFLLSFFFCCLFVYCSVDRNDFIIFFSLSLFSLLGQLEQVSLCLKSGKFVDYMSIMVKCENKNSFDLRDIVTAAKPSLSLTFRVHFKMLLVYCVVPFSTLRDRIAVSSHILRLNTTSWYKRLEATTRLSCECALLVKKIVIQKNKCRYIFIDFLNNYSLKKKSSLNSFCEFFSSIFFFCSHVKNHIKVTF